MIARGILLLILPALLAGCNLFSRPDNQFYSLDTVPSDLPPADLSGTPIGIDAIELPPAIDRRGIVLRGEDSRLEVRGTHQWAAPFESMVLHTLAFNLANRLPEGMVVLPGQVKPVGAMRSIDIIVEELAAGPDRILVLDARWTLRDTGTTSPGLAVHERITVDLGSLDSGDIASGISQALATFADRIVAQLGGAGGQLD